MMSKQTRRCCNSKPPAATTPIKSLHVVLGKTTDLRSLTHEYRHHTSYLVEELFIEPSCSYSFGLAPTVSEPDWDRHLTEARRLFRALGDFPQLKKIHIKCLGASGCGFPLELLTALLINPMREMYLQELVLEQCQFSSQDDYDHDRTDLVLAVRFLNNLKRLECDERAFRFPGAGGMWEEDDQDVQDRHGGCCNAQFIQTIMELPRLQDLKFAAPHNSSVCKLDSAALETFVTSSRSLSLKNFQLDSSSLAALAMAMESPACCLDSLDLDISHAWAAVNDLFQAFASNTSLTNLELWVSDMASWKEHQCSIVLANALVQNTHLKSLKLRGLKPFSEDSIAAFCKILEANDTLTEIELFGASGERLAPAIEFYTTLNAKDGGRKQKLQDMSNYSMSQWMQVLGDTNTRTSRMTDDGGMHNLEGLYFWLRRNPSVITSVDSSSSSQENVSKNDELIYVDC
ncbi:expressed unknown protein [Seminavis robusta]|uniref:Uncharacterized protein n=1 Tax=Seminavis robusta TaxID=568900 RepID=A0A9N8ENW1_9STRA|nr:expressed unknown protein [Seminavis robusta]|eukprot:Sro1654_g288880.1 n/a (459) ;mRNA; f:4447-5823